VFGHKVKIAAGADRATASRLVPQGRRVFKSLTVRENLIVAARKPAQGGAAVWTLDTVFRMFPRLRAAQPDGGASLRRRAADAGDRPRPDGQSARTADGRTVGRPGAQIVAEVMTTIRRLKESGLSIVLVEQNPNLVFESRTTS